VGPVAWLTPPADVWIPARDPGASRTLGRAGATYAACMNLVARRHRLAGFIDGALAPRIWHGRRLAAVPIPRNVLAVCRDALRDLADALRDERRSVDAATLEDISRLLTRGPTSPLYDAGHPIRALHAIVAAESRFGHTPARAA
jgi:hypothetical protein